MSIDLSEIPGLGPVRRQALAEAGIQDLQGLLALKVAQLAEIRGIGIWQARKIREFLRQRGLLIESDEEEGAILVAAPRTIEEAQAVTETIQAIEAQAAVEARVAEQVEALAQAVADAQRDAEAAEAQDTAVGSVGSDRSDRSEVAEEELDLCAQITSQREKLPETALILFDGIRQAAVARQLTRQITRLLITAGEFVSDSRPLAAEGRARASKELAAAEQLLQRALEQRAFSEKEQQGLARRIRRRRKELERVLEKA